ncbi:hypothetical protein TKK_0012471 [Trichogramma kaykai]
MWSSENTRASDITPTRGVGKIAAMTKIEEFNESEEPDNADNSTHKNGPKRSGPDNKKKGSKKAKKNTIDQNLKNPTGPMVNAV